MANSVSGPWESSKVLSNAKLAPKNLLVTVWQFDAHLIHSTYLNPSETITSKKYAQPIDEMHSTLQHLQPALVNRKGPILLHNKAQPHFAQPMVEKLNELGYKVLPHLPYSPDLLPFDYHFFKHLDNLCREKASILAGCRKCFLRVCQIPKHRFLYYSNKQTFFIGKKCVVCHDSYFD